MKTLLQYNDTFWEFDTEQSNLILEVGKGFFSGNHQQLYETKNNRPGLFILIYMGSKHTVIMSRPKAIEFYYRQTKDLDGVRKVFKQGVPVI